MRDAHHSLKLDWRPGIPRIILVRHGETDWNVERRAQGWNDQPLNARGLQQAELVGRYVREKFKPAFAWTSDLQRCAQTAGAICLPTTSCEGLREIRFGSWEGMYWSDIFARDAAMAARWVAGDADFQAPGGERLRDLVERARRFVDESGLLASSQDVAVVTHGGTMKALIVALLDLPATATAKFYVGNCTVSIVNVVDGVVRLESLNDSSHLEAAALTPVNTAPGVTRRQIRP